ncbi:MAG: hypothetical protein IRZ32_14575 [Solirubrobacteraceae bacterium]|nr:hypothetical protein [Solirubrobacteraceae bacterium]
MAEPAPAPGTYPFGRAAGSFYLGGCEDALPDARPLLAYGANASPAALAGKLGSGAVAAALAGTLRGWAAVHSRHVSPYGQVPATLVPAPGAALAVHILLVADPAALDATEPNYERVALRGLDLVADRLGPVAEADAYLSRHGPLLVDGAPVPLGALPQARLRAAVGA